jgi:hypothetical protein
MNPLTPARVSEIRAALASSTNIAATCAALKTSHRTAYRYASDVIDERKRVRVISYKRSKFKGGRINVSTMKEAGFIAGQRYVNTVLGPGQILTTRVP